VSFQVRERQLGEQGRGSRAHVHLGVGNDGEQHGNDELRDHGPLPCTPVGVPKGRAACNYSTTGGRRRAMRGLAEFTKTTLIGGVLVILPVWISTLLLLKAIGGIFTLLSPVTAALPPTMAVRHLVSL